MKTNFYTNRFLLLWLAAISQVQPHKIMAIALLSLIPAGTQAQDVATPKITWKAGKAEDVKNNQVFNFSCDFVKTGQTISWVQRNGAFIQRFDITSAEGSWIDISGPGKMIYYVSGEGQNGKFVAERKASGITFIVDFTTDNAEGIHYRFTIDEIKTENQ